MDDGQAPTDRRNYLEIYLQDHRAGAAAGVKLAQRCADHAPDRTTAATLSEIVADIEADCRTLDEIMTGLGVDASSLKNAAALAGERLGRFKLNGRLTRTSPLSVVVEIEALIGAVSVKRQLWASLSVLASNPHGPDRRLETLMELADDQRARLQALHAQLVQDLFGISTAPSTGIVADPDVQRGDAG